MELLVGMALSLVIFAATLTIIVVGSRNFQGRTQRDDAQNQARLAVDLISRQLRNVSSPVSAPTLIERATPYDIVFQAVGTPSGSNATGVQRVRYCVPADGASGSSATEVLRRQTQTWSTATPPSSPWSSDASVSIPCPDTSTTSSQIAVPSVTSRLYGRTDRPVFTFNGSTAAPSDLTQITSVGIDLFVNPTPSSAAAESELRTSIFLRNQHRLPVANFTITDTGNGGVLLNGGTSYSPDGYDLSYGWSCTSSGCPSTASLTAASDGLVDWQPGAGTYTVKLTVTDPEGLSASTTQQVSVS